jgi:hypothetical protein
LEVEKIIKIQMTRGSNPQVEDVVVVGLAILLQDKILRK